MYATAEDHALLRAWKNGDQAAGSTLVERHYARVHRFFDLKATAAADDLTQHTFLGLVERIDTLHEHATFGSYLFGIARYQLFGYLRREERRSAAMMLEASAQPEAGTPLSMVAVKHQEHHLLLVAMSQLSTDQQIAVELYYWEGMRAGDIANVLGVNASTMTTRLARARERLRQLVLELSRPGRVREALLADLEGWQRSLGPVTAAANARSGG